MSREELVMDMIGEIGDKYILEALPEHAEKPDEAQTDNVIHIKPVEANIEISKKDLRIYWITHSLGVAAAAILIIGAAVLLIMNWDKIAVSGGERPGVVTTVTSDIVTPDITEPDTTDRFEQITDTSMPEPYPYNDHEYYRDFYYTWINRFSGVSGNLTDLPDMEKQNDLINYYTLNRVGTPYTLDDNLNLYSWMTKLDLSVDNVCRAIEENNEYYSSQPFGHSEELIFNPYEIDVLKSGDRSRIAEAFATEYSIIIGDKVFNPEWLYYHTIEDYSAVGITPEEVLHKLDMYEGLGLTDDAWAAFSAKLQKYADNADPFGQITDTTMPEPYDSMEYPLGNFDFYSLWQAKLFGADQIVHFDYEKQNEYRKRVEGIETPYTLYDSPNFYGMARIMRLTDDEITEATKTINEHFENSTNLLNNTSYIYTEEDIAVIKNADDSAAAQHFASEYSIVVGEYAFCPMWLYYHTIEDYKSVGITPEEVLHKLDMYEGLGLTDEAWAAFSAKLQKYIDNDLPIAEFDYDDMKLVVTQYEFDGSTMNLYYDVMFDENSGADKERMKSKIPALTFLIFSEYRQKIDTVSESENSLSMVRTITIDEPQDSVAVQCFPIDFSGKVSQELWDKYTFTAVKNTENAEPALKEWTTAKKTFDIEYYNPYDLPGMAAGGGLPFDGIAADGAAFKTIKPQGAPISYSYRTDNFFADSDSESYEIIPDDLMEILKEYSDGDSLKYDLGGELPALSSYTMLDDTDLLEEYGTKAYRVSIEYLVSVSQNMENAGYYVRFYRRSEEYTEIRRIIELLWNKHDSSYPFNVFSVQSAGGENEGLMIVADDSLSMPGEQIDVLAQIKQLLAENGLPDKARVEFVTPGQLRSEWVPIDLCYTDGTPVDLSQFPGFVKYGGVMYLKVDGWFSTPNEVADKLDELGKINAAKAMRGEIGIDNIGDKTKAETELFDLTQLDSNIMGGYGLLGNDVLIGQNIAGYDIYLYEPRFSSAVGAVTLLRAALTSYFEGRYRLELRIYGDPRLDPADVKYTVKIYADRENWDDIKTFLETGSSDSVVWQFEDYQ